MATRRDKRNSQGRQPLDAIKEELKAGEVKTIDEFRAKYLPSDVRLRAAQRLTPQEAGEELARTSLSAAKEVLTGQRSSTVRRKP